MFRGNSIVIQGFTIPSNHPVFLAILALHIVAALIAVVAGVFAMLSKKQKGLHPKSGTIYFWCLLVTFITATFMTVLRWEEDYHLFIMGFLSFSLVLIAKMAVTKKWKKWPIIHISGMGLSYILLLTAFYVDNGKFLPIWRDFSPLVYWLLPALVGIPIICITLIKNPLSNSYFKKHKTK